MGSADESTTARTRIRIVSDTADSLCDMIVLDGSLRIDWLTERLRPWMNPAGFDRWRSSARSAITLHSIDMCDGPLVGRTGGLPDLPIDAEWPVWYREDDSGQPLHFVAQIDCAALPAVATEIGFPAEGTLLFFHFDDENFEEFALPGGAAYPDGFRVLYTGADEIVTSRQAPEGLEIYPPQGLVAKAVHMLRFVPWENDAAERNSRFDRYTMDLPRVGHLAGFPGSLQDDVEELIDEAIAQDEALAELMGTEKRAAWLPLATFDYERHDGLLYYLIQSGDLAARRFDRTMFSWQCT
ncbi:DUF1963 domain-containing protein [Nocardia asiatica]|uniref:DUF1963 domain-containing protein n=1 Tax=Nocardia asiatica TaxID=209252 RepID=UPI003EE20CEF